MSYNNDRIFTFQKLSKMNDENNNQYENRHIIRTGFRTPSKRSFIQEYLCSASPKRKKIKTAHCWFCDILVHRNDFAHHLASKEQCLKLYVEILHLNSSRLTAVMLKLHHCINCWIIRPIRLGSHLRKYQHCFERFKSVLGLDSIESICD